MLQWVLGSLFGYRPLQYAAASLAGLHGHSLQYWSGVYNIAPKLASIVQHGARHWCMSTLGAKLAHAPSSGIKLPTRV